MGQKMILESSLFPKRQAIRDFFGMIHFELIKKKGGGGHI